jgi:peptide/nickel transport system permease protein
MVLILLSLIAIVFILQHLSPVDPVKVLIGPQASEAAQQEYAKRLGLDKPLVVQNLMYVRDVLHGDFGISVRTQGSVGHDLSVAVPATAELMVFAAFIAGVLALLIALTSAARARGAGIVRSTLLAGASAPPFLLALLGILVLSNRLGWVPGNGRTSYYDAPDGPTGLLTVDALLAGRLDVAVDAVHHLLLPAVCISLISAVGVGRVLRGSLLDSLNADYARTARSKGLTRGEIIRRHVFRNSVGPGLSMAGLQLGVMFASDVIVEQIFGWPGVGSYLAQSIPANDFPAVAAVTVVLGIAYVVINAAVDILQVIADPRLRL